MMRIRHSLLVGIIKRLLRDSRFFSSLISIRYYSFDDRRLKMSEPKMSSGRMPGKIPAILPILVLLVIMITNYVLGWGQDPHIPVLIACVVAMIVGRVYGFTYKEMLAGALSAVSQSLEAIIIILCVGCLIGSFEWSGAIPAVVYYGLKIIAPGMFLPLACILCSIVGIALGSAWTVTATLGIAFMSIGATMGLNPALVESRLGCRYDPLRSMHRR